MPEADNEDPKRRRIQTRRREAREVAERFVAGPARRALGWPEGPVEALPPLGGARSLIYMAGPKGQTPRAVVRLFDTERERRRYCRALRLAGGRGAPTPAVLYRGTGWLERLRYGFRFLVTERAPGLPLNETPAERSAAEALGGAMARLHGIESSRWGRPSRRSRKPFVADLRRGILRRLEELGSRPSDFTNAEIETAREWFLERLDGLDFSPPFQLCHHHLAADDILYDPAPSRITLVDCASLQFSRAARDLAAVRLMPWLSGDGLWEAFFEAYLRGVSEERRRVLESEEPLFTAWIWLSRARNVVRRFRGDGPVGFAEGSEADIRQGFLRSVGVQAASR